MDLPQFHASPAHALPDDGPVTWASQFNLAAEPIPDLGCPTDPCDHLIRRAWAMLAAMKLVEGRAIVEEIDELDLESHAPLSGHGRFRRALLRAVVVALNDDVDSAYEQVRAALVKYPPGVGHPVTSLLLRLGHWKARRMEDFCELSRPVGQPSGCRGEAMAGILHLSMESAVELEQLRLVSAGRLAGEALELAKRLHGPDFAGARLAATLSAWVLYEQNLVDTADRLIRDRLVLSSSHGGVEGALSAYIIGARIAAARRQVPFAILVLREAELLGEEQGWPRLVAASLAERVRILIEDERMREAKACASRLAGLPARTGVPANDLHVARCKVVAEARLELASGPSARTAASLRQLAAECLRRRECQVAVEVRLLLACALHRIGLDDEARMEALRVIELGANAGLYRTFIDGGVAVRELLTWLYELRNADASVLGELRPCVRHLLVGFPEGRKAEGGARGRHRSGESLSPRERHIVELMSHGFSNKQIAKQLAIAPETVKSHAKHILLKLAAQTRVEAVTRAFSLGII